jgi:hypothetical protein
LLQNQSGMMQERIALLRECHALAMTMNQLDADAVFKMFDARTGSGQRQIRTLGGARQIFCSSQIYKQFQIDEIEVHSSIPL